MQDSDSFKHAVDQFNAGEYYACHDTLEALWTEALDPERRFYQGLLQAAVAYYHLGRGNWRGAVLLLGESLAKLGSYCPTFAHLDVEALVEDNRRILTQLQRLGPDQLSALTEHPRPRWHWRAHE
jgi:hypothetical protein